MLQGSLRQLPYRERALVQLDGLIGLIEGDLAECRRRGTAEAPESSHLAADRLELLRRSRTVLLSEFPLPSSRRN